MENLEQPIILSPVPDEDVKENILGKEGEGGSKDMEQEQVSSDTFGKFKDAKSLLSAYNSLQSDYTRKCQLLSNLNKTLENNQTKEEDSSSDKAQKDYPFKFSALSKEEQESVLQEYIFANPDLKDKVLAKYFEELSLPHSPRLMAGDRGSGFVLSQREKPKDLEEAGQIAKNLLNEK